MINEFENITYDSVKYIFNGEHHSIKLFLNLLNAVANGELDSPENDLDDDVIYNYRMIRPLIEDFVNETIYESIYKNDMYDGLIKGLIDIFSCLHTVVYMRKHITDVDIQPKEVVYNYLQSFGFPAISEFSDYQKKEIARNVYGFLRKKGTPEIIKRILGQLGYPFFCICEFWLTKNSNGTYILKPEIIEEFSSFNTLNTSWELFLRNRYFTLNEVRDIDPLWVISDSDLNNQISNGRMTLPAKSAYFQFGVAASITDDERIVSSILYAIAKKNLYEYSTNELTRDVRFPLFPKYKLSPLDLIYAYAVLGYNFGKTYDIFGLNATGESNTFDIEGTLKKFDKDMVFDTISRRSIYIASNPENNNYHRKITTKCIGWNGDITITPIGDSIKEIRNLYNQTYNLIKYYPTRVKFNEYTGLIDIETPKTRYTEKNSINKKYFISNALFGDIDDTLIQFEKYNPRFYEFVKDYIDKYTGTEEYEEKIYNFMFEIIKSLEMYIYNKSGIQFNMKQQFIKYSDFNYTTRHISNSFAPYHAKMFDAFYIYIIRELPFDQILISDTSTNFNGMEVKATSKNFDPYWKVIYYKNGTYPDPRKFAGKYNSIDNIKFYKSGGSYDSTNTKTINGVVYNPFYSMGADYANSIGKSELYSGYKTKLQPHSITDNMKMRFIVDITRDEETYEITKIDIYSRDGTDKITDPLTILSRVSPSMYNNVPRFMIEVNETYYDSYNDEEPIYRKLPESKLKRNINSTDDPRWNDRIETIKISKYEEDIIDSNGYFYIGSVASTDISINIENDGIIDIEENNE